MSWLFLLLALMLSSCRHPADVPDLVLAARDGRVDLIAKLVKQGANPNLRSGVNGWTPLEHAVHKNQRAAVIALLDAGADANARDHDGSTALMMAAGYGYTGIVQVLQDRGADPHFEANDGSNALTRAVLGVPDIDHFTLDDCQVSTVRALLDKTTDLRFNGPSGPRRAITLAKIKSCAGLEQALARRTR